jgi:hypothetical protein
MACGRGLLGGFYYRSIDADRQGVGCIYAIFQPFHEGFGFSMVTKFHAPGVHQDHPAFGRARLFDLDQHR